MGITLTVTYASSVHYTEITGAWKVVQVSSGWPTSSRDIGTSDESVSGDKILEGLGPLTRDLRVRVEVTEGTYHAPFVDKSSLVIEHFFLFLFRAFRHFEAFIRLYSYCVDGQRRSTSLAAVPSACELI